MAAGFTVPGQVSSAVVGSTFQNMTPQDYAEQERLRREREQKREASNAAVMAQRNTEQQAARDAADREKVQQAFNTMYGPQLQNAYHDTMVQREGVSGPMGIPSKAPAGFTGSPFASNVPFGSTAVPGQRGAVAPYRMPEAQLNQMLANMWQQQTDPYMMTAAKMSGSMPKPASYVGGAGGRPGGGKTKQKDE